jgi:cytoskeletal protein RodZ
MEADQVAALPGVFFYRSFVRQYACLLGVNWTNLQAEVRALTALAEPDPAPLADQPIRAPDPVLDALNRIELSLSGRGWAAPVTLLAVAILGGAGLFGWWKSTREQTPAPAQTELQESLPRPEGPTVNVTATTGADGVKRLELNLSATEITWLSITSGGQEIFSGTLYPEQTKTVSGLSVARLKVGNAGGLSVQWNGQEIGPLGESGQVRVVVFTPEGFRILRREDEAPGTQSAL